MNDIKVAVIGGSGLYNMEAFTDVQEVQIETPFGSPSDVILVGTLEGMQVAFLARHGRTHRFLPTELPYRANIYALKSLGVEYIISASAVGSLKEEVKPLDLVVPDQFIDRTRQRVSTFFGDGVVAHIAFGDPICHNLSKVLGDAIASLDLPDINYHLSGTYICMEGPAFSTKAESNLYRSWGGTIIGMTNLTEAKLAREAEIAYATLALVTDYDCWHPDHDSVTVEMVIQNLRHNAVTAQKVIQETIRRLKDNLPESDAHSALKYAILTPLSHIPDNRLQQLKLLLQKYV